jgi:DNA polymerase III subunit gamma/tau
MAHNSLYRAHRPETFDDVVGQADIVSALRSQAQSGTPAHAYLFAGSRGLGKTSLARIFAKALGTTEKDLYEIDAASNNSVDGIRALNENAFTLPFESPYKIYILDEAHMLSKSAWNAFLKTLEEPPQHVIFILATTERDRVPDTVESRCQTFSFRKPQVADLEALISRVANKEGIALEPGAVSLIAALADGSYRDSLSVLGKVVAAAGGQPITRELAEQATGAPRRELVEGYLRGISTKDAPMALQALSRASSEGLDLRVFSTLALQSAREALFARHAPDLAPARGSGNAIDPSISAGLTHQMLVCLLTAHERLGFAPLPELPLELAVYECCE